MEAFMVGCWERGKTLLDQRINRRHVVLRLASIVALQGEWEVVITSSSMLCGESNKVRSRRTMCYASMSSKTIVNEC